MEPTQRRGDTEAVKEVNRRKRRDMFESLKSERGYHAGTRRRGQGVRKAARRESRVSAFRGRTLGTRCKPAVAPRRANTGKDASGWLGVFY